MNENSTETGSVANVRDLIIKMVLNGEMMFTVWKELDSRYPELGLTYETVRHIARDSVTIVNNVTGTKAFYNGRPRRECVMELHDTGMGPRAISDKLGIPYEKVCADVSYSKRKREEERQREEVSIERQAFSPKLQQTTGVDY